RYFPGKALKAQLAARSSRPPNHDQSASDRRRHVNTNRPAVMAPSSARHRMTTLTTKPTTPPTSAGTQSPHGPTFDPRPETGGPEARSTTAGRRRDSELNQGRRATKAGPSAPVIRQPASPTLTAGRKSPFRPKRFEIQRHTTMRAKLETAAAARAAGGQPMMAAARATAIPVTIAAARICPAEIMERPQDGGEVRVTARLPVQRPLQGLLVDGRPACPWQEDDQALTRPIERRGVRAFL